MRTWKKKKHLPQNLGTEDLRKKERKNVISNENKNENNTKKNTYRKQEDLRIKKRK